MRCKTSFSSLLILLSPLLVLILASNVVSLSSSCQPESCGSIKIPYPFGIQEGCYLNEWYKIECRDATFPFLSKMRMEVVDISLTADGAVTYANPTSYGSVRVKVPITSVGCSRDGKESTSVLNLTDSPFFIGSGNSLVAVGCNSKASLTNIEPSIVGCELRCTANKGEEERSCDGNGCCRASLPDVSDAHQVIGLWLESFDDDENSTCKVAFLTDEVYMSSNVTEPERLFVKGHATVSLGWVIQTKNLPFLDSLSF